MAEKEEKTVVEKPKAKAEPTFEKEAIINSGEFSAIEKDMLKAFVKEDEKLSIKQAKKIVSDYKKGEIN